MKKNFKSLIASILAVTMIFALAACGTPGGSPSGNSGSETAPDFVYVSSFQEVKNEDNQAIGASCFTPEGFYTTPSEVIGRREPKEGETEQWEGQFDILAEQLFFVSYDGQRTQLEGYEPFAFTPAEGHDGGASMYRLAADAQGNLAAIYQTWESWSDAPADLNPEDPSYWDYEYHYDVNWYVRTMDKSGRTLDTIKLENALEDWSYPSDFAYVDGKSIVAAYDGLHIFSDGGEKRISTDGYIQSLVTLRDGTFCMAYYDNLSSGMKLGAIDLASGRISRTWALPQNGYGYISGGGDYDLYYQSGINLYGYTLETESSEKLFDWLNADVSSQNLCGYTVRADGSFFGVVNTWDSKWENVTTEFVTLEKKSLSEAPQKETLTLACQWADSTLQEAVIRFNRSSKVRINVIEYYQYNNENDWNAGITKLTTEIMAGNMPDILSLQEMPYQQMAAKGLLEDLYPFMEKDSEISRDDFLPNVLRALEVDGKLCSTVSTFTVSTLVGAASVVGSEPGWSAAELLAAYRTMPEGCTVLSPNTTSGDILRAELTIDSDYYIDWTSGKVNFDSQEFVDLLNFSKLFPDSFDWETYDYESESSRITEGRQMLMRMSLGSFEDLAMNEAQFGGDMTYIGYPTASGVGSYLELNSGYAISSSCADKEAAWQFLRGFMTEKALENTWYWGFPANRKLLDKQLQEAMTVEYEKDENGNYRLDGNGERIPVSKGGVWIEDTDEIVDFYALTQAQADKVMEVINTTDKLYMENTAVLDIIFEQADAFLSGQKTAEEVARLVQGKMMIYVNEQR